jgi:thiol-disulfide isomerase/thioredoxin
MAKSKSTYSKKNDRTLTYIIVGFGVVILALIGGLLIYNAFNETIDYDSFTHIQSYNDLPDQSEDSYLVYYYGENCTHCRDIKTQFLDFAYNNSQGIKVYLMDSSRSTDWPVQWSAQYEDYIPVYGTPTVFTVVDGTIVDISRGSIEVMDTVDDITSGTYAFIN